MTNLAVASMKEKDFLAACEQAKSERKARNPINTAPLSIEKQLDRFRRNSFTEEEVAAHHRDAISV